MRRLSGPPALQKIKDIINEFDALKENSVGAAASRAPSAPTTPTRKLRPSTSLLGLLDRLETNAQDSATVSVRPQSSIKVGRSASVPVHPSRPKTALKDIPVGVGLTKMQPRNELNKLFEHNYQFELQRKEKRVGELENQLLELMQSNKTEKEKELPPIKKDEKRVQLGQPGWFQGEYVYTEQEREQIKKNKKRTDLAVLPV